MPKRLFQKGDKRPPGSGRVKGQSNHLQQSVRNILHGLISEDEFRALWWKKLHSKDEAISMDALRIVTQYMFGKPAQSPIHPDDMPQAIRGGGDKCAQKKFGTGHAQIKEDKKLLPPAAGAAKVPRIRG